MFSHRRKNIVASRRRRHDEDEEEGSQAGDVDDDSLSEGSAPSNPDDDADADASDNSEDGPPPEKEGSLSNGHANGDASIAKDTSDQRQATSGQGLFATAATDTAAMMNGLKLSDDTSAAPEINFDDMADEMDPDNTNTGKVISKSSKRETPAERKRREHEDYLKEKAENPAFVPTRGGFFLHDDRSSGTGVNGHRSFNIRGRGRGRGDVAPTRRQVGGPEPTDGQWAHDLHEIVADETTSSIPQDTVESAAQPPFQKPIPAAPRAAPNRSFSTTVLVGNVPVVVSLPGMPHPIPFHNVAKRQYTKLPHHRPPLRRDKPVRVSIPDQPPRYIFPATERSFIFIPRAMRPNQQAFARGRGRGSFYGSRRTSMYGGSAYTPSVAMSRRSSFGHAGSRDGLHSPAGSVLSRGAVATQESGRPVVRLPPSARTGSMDQSAMPIVGPPVVATQPQVVPSIQKPTLRENRPTPIPMHQPRPQKAVSVADIESPATFSFNPPQQQQEQPFHQQVPPQVNGHPFAQDSYHPHSRHPSHPSQPSGTPLSQIPERAIHAQPFQPYPVQPPPQGYFAAPYPPGAVFFAPPPPNGEGYPSAAAPAFVPGQQPGTYVMPAGPPPPPPQPAAGGDQNAGQGANTVAHESNGMVYYYDSSQMYPGGMTAPPPFQPGYPVAPAGGVVGMGGMMTPPGNYYYPQVPGGVYYAPQ